MNPRDSQATSAPDATGEPVQRHDHGVDPTRPSFVSYIDKSRAYYAARGSEHPYRWAHDHGTPPFTALRGPLSSLRLGVVTTSTLPPPLGEKPPSKVAFAAPVEPRPAAMFTMDLGWDKEATHTDDPESFLPLTRLQELADEGRVGSLSPRFYGVPTQYSQRSTTTIDAPAILELMREDAVDVALLVPL